MAVFYQIWPYLANFWPYSIKYGRIWQILGRILGNNEQEEGFTFTKGKEPGRILVFVHASCTHNILESTTKPPFGGFRKKDGPYIPRQSYSSRRPRQNLV